MGVMRSRVRSAVLVLSIMVGSGAIFCGSTSLFNERKAEALSYKSSVGVNFTFNPVLSISLSSADLIIPNLAPGSYSDSNEITVSVNTNAAYGYYLTATAGTSSTNTDLTSTNASITSKFTSLATTAGAASTLANISDNYWGYSYSNDNGTTWISGNVDNSASGYAGLPLDNDDNGETGTVLINNADNTSSSVRFKIGAKASSVQPAGEYTNVINFYAVTNPTPNFLYDAVKNMSKGKQTLADLRATITTPTSTDPSEDTSNSGVFEYNSNVFGTSSDANNAYPIYYYRGILETNPGTYGSAGSANAYPNYVKLSNNTCWRIVRTTGSGGIKMIYNGTWTGSSCANSGDSVQVTTQAFNDTYNSIVYVGYTYNSSYTQDSNTNNKTVDEVLGSNSNPSANNTRSTIKTYIEDTWYASNMTDYTNILEANAGYCNDRSYFGSTSNTNINDMQTTVSTSETVYFGAFNRHFVNNSIGPTLTCLRGAVDIYRYVANSAGTSNELKYPVALLTADEAALAGSGRSSGNPTTYSSQSYLRSISSIWLLSPDLRYSTGDADGFILASNGYLSNGRVYNASGVRPAISLIPGTIITSGTGTATDPWMVE